MARATKARAVVLLVIAVLCVTGVGARKVAHQTQKQQKAQVVKPKLNLKAQSVGELEEVIIVRRPGDPEYDKEQAHQAAKSKTHTVVKETKALAKHDQQHDKKAKSTTATLSPPNVGGNTDPATPKRKNGAQEKTLSTGTESQIAPETTAAATQTKKKQPTTTTTTTTEAPNQAKQEVREIGHPNYTQFIKPRTKSPESPDTTDNDNNNNNNNNNNTIEDIVNSSSIESTHHDVDPEYERQDSSSASNDIEFETPVRQLKREAMRYKSQYVPYAVQLDEYERNLSTPEHPSLGDFLKVKRLSEETNTVGSGLVASSATDSGPIVKIV